MAIYSFRVPRTAIYYQEIEFEIEADNLQQARALARQATVDYPLVSNEQIVGAIVVSNQVEEVLELGDMVRVTSPASKPRT